MKFQIVFIENLADSAEYIRAPAVLNLRSFEVCGCEHTVPIWFDNPDVETFRPGVVEFHIVFLTYHYPLSIYHEIPCTAQKLMVFTELQKTHTATTG